jgi:PKD repeat protein
MKRFYVMLLGVALANMATAQHQMCGTDELSYQLYSQSDAAAQQRMANNRAYLKNYTEQFIANEQARGSSDSLYIIPVVFHVIHAYGAENVSDAQIMSGLYVLNRNFSNLHPDTATIPSVFKSIAADCDIEFRLAHKDPNGLCTNGINRIASLRTKIGDHSVKDLIHWDPSKYLNVYVVKSIANLAGHCLMPDQADAKPEWDGIVIDDSYLGNTGTSTEQTSVVMAHEAGHYLNLFHIWGGNNVPGYFYQPVGQPGNCAIGDDVTDTPPTIGWSNCNLNATSCGNTIDNVQNAMDYSYCNFMFTQGQRQRMRAALNSPIADRNNLITPANHTATGIDLQDLCKADFKPERYMTCILESLQFTDLSIATPDTWLWNFGDGETSIQQNPVHVYYTAGNYPVTLMVTKGLTTITAATQTVYVSDQNPVAAYVQDFESVSNISDIALLNQTDNAALAYQFSGSVGYNSNSSAWVRTNDTTEAYAGRTSLLSSAINLSGKVNVPFSFRYACAQRSFNSDDALEVFMSNNCGHTWQSMGVKKAANLRTIASANNNPSWAPADSTEWKTYSYTIPPAYCVSNFMFRIDYTSFLTNSFYIDNINVNAEDFTTIEETASSSLSITPNPVLHHLQLETEHEGLVTVTDALGKVVYSTHTDGGHLDINCAAWNSGIYLVGYSDVRTQSWQKIVKY